MTIYFVNEENPSQVYTERNIECDEKPESLYKVYKEIEGGFARNSYGN